MNDASMWVQAAASIILACITGYYVKLTKHIAASASAQADLMEKQREFMERQVRLDRERRFWAVLVRITRLNSALTALPAEPQNGHDRLIRNCPIWSSNELESFADHAAQLGDAIALIASDVANNLNWLGQKVADVRATHVNTGFVYTNFPWQEWLTHWSDAQDGLARIDAAVRDALVAADVT